MAKRMCGGACPWTDHECDLTPEASCEIAPCKGALEIIEMAEEEATWFAAEMAEGMEEDEE